MKADAAAAASVSGPFLKAAQEEEGAITTATGLVYKELQAGTGASPTASDSVSVHYVGTLSDGTKFDSSRDRGEPSTFKVGQVIKGWQEGLQLMKVGGKAKLSTIPAELAYGPNPMGSHPGVVGASVPRGRAHGDCAAREEVWALLRNLESKLWQQISGEEAPEVSSFCWGCGAGGSTSDDASESNGDTAADLEREWRHASINGHTVAELERKTIALSCTGSMCDIGIAERRMCWHLTRAGCGEIPGGSV